MDSVRDFYIDYNRVYDLELTFNENTPFNEVTGKLYGIKKLAQVFINIFLKEFESRSLGLTYSAEIMKTLLRESIESTLNLIKNEYYNGPEDEQIDSVIIQEISVDFDRVKIILELITKAGKSTPVGIGYITE